jgi:iron complex transport system ATP-binding protein
VSGLVVSGARIAIGGKTILGGVEFAAHAGQLTGLLGSNGAGKSTLMRAILALQPLDAGSITFDEVDILSLARRERARLAAFVEQSGATETHLSAREAAMLGRIPFQSIWHTSHSVEDEEAVATALAAVGMSSLADRSFDTLSGGEQQRIHLARALAQQPKLLVLDEPTNHLDIHAQLTTLALLQGLARKGATVLLSLHDLNLAAAFCDSLVVLNGGNVVAQGEPSAVLTASLLRDVYQVEASVLPHPLTGRPLLAFDAPQ